VRRSRPALHLRRNPLVLVLAQARIAPVLQIAEYIPRLQERFRKAGYPRFGTSQVQDVLFTLAGASQASSTQRFHFSDAGNRRGLIITREFITYQVTDYETFDQFAEQFLAALELFWEEVDVSLVERIGLRYVDLIVPERDEKLTDWIEPGLHGLNLPISREQSRYELRGATDVGELVVKANRPLRGFIPEDLQPFDLMVSKEAPLPEAPYLVLDFDHYSTEARTEPPATLIDAFWNLHDVLDMAFRSAVTPQAIAAWS